ncbi:hypothetical protein WAF17_20525 [Bernardetia sp. ABR2-2B]|uniref:hypothetical protein n=1 Tax=Bernardetia sp. ABR2-2B TaxID=3127472 RepID=UPI0030CE6FA5
MPQNQSSNKLSSLIGFLLLIGIIGFTIFTNIPIKEVEKEFKPFTQNELDNFWELDSIETKAGRAIQRERKYSIHFEKKIKINWDTIKFKIETEKDTTTVIRPNDSTYYLGTILFKSKVHREKAKPLLFQKFRLEYYKSEKDSLFLKRLGKIFLKYQISYITTRSDYGNFTTIKLKDGRKIFLLKKDSEIVEGYKELLESAEYLNDSTRIIFPSHK